MSKYDQLLEWTGGVPPIEGPMVAKIGRGGKELKPHIPPEQSVMHADDIQTAAFPTNTP